MSANLASSGDGNTPLYLQLAQQLRQNIASGTPMPGQALPSERDLCDQFSASRVTIRKAIDMLAHEGLVERRQGAGTFVLNRIETTGSALRSFSEDARQRGQQAQSLWLMKGSSHASREEAELLQIRTGDPLSRFSRVRLSDGEPLAIENAVIPSAFLPDPELVETSLYDALRANGAQPVQGRQKLRACLATSTEAGLLSIAENDPVLRIERLTFLADGRPVELTRSAYRGDRFDFVCELRGDL